MFSPEAFNGDVGRVPKEEVEALSEGIELDSGIIIASENQSEEAVEVPGPTWPEVDSDTIGRIAPEDMDREMGDSEPQA